MDRNRVLQFTHTIRGALCRRRSLLCNDMLQLYASVIFGLVCQPCGPLSELAKPSWIHCRLDGFGQMIQLVTV
ncbi:hypothetical protein DAEQUDRAFT_384005 [Daedalea quercina L-15889]|uniref:Uncharacterized protein n=1 Tax=Daedalea quercina L-15889 TaxID=1314783 RepID=A0A165P0Y6_9APHY|nr:hypothetical protein DAEQUDRAFT_384005 [Daedalea quercina L-15889]